jgi:hypothetical protein
MSSTQTGQQVMRAAGLAVAAGQRLAGSPVVPERKAGGGGRRAGGAADYREHLRTAGDHTGSCRTRALSLDATAGG